MTKSLRLSYGADSAALEAERITAGNIFILLS